MPKPNTTPAALRRLLQEEYQIARRMVELAEQESEAIVANDIVTLNSLERELKLCMDQQAALDQARSVVTRTLAWAAGMDQQPTLLALVPHLPKSEQGALLKLRQQFLETQKHLEMLNARNRLLLENAMEYVRFSLDLLTTAVLQPARYGTNIASISTPTFYVDSKA